MSYGDKNIMLESINNIKLTPKKSKLKVVLLTITTLVLVSGANSTFESVNLIEKISINNQKN